MSDVSLPFVYRYASGEHVGIAKPVITARIRRGEFHHGYRGAYTMLDGTVEDFASIEVKGEDPNNPWSGEWVPRTPWMDLPQVYSYQRDKSFDNNGIATVTLQIENVFYQAVAGVLGNYYLFRRGYFAPWRGFLAPGRPQPNWDQLNEWQAMLQGSAQIDVFTGYGEDTLGRRFTGLVDDVDMTSSPDQITITMRDFGGPVLTEQRLFDTNKDPKIKVPITFADRLSSDDLKRVGFSAKASSADSSHPAKELLDTRESTAWESVDHGADNWTEWCEIRIPRGRYESFIVSPAWGGMEAFLSIYNRDRVVADPRHHVAEKKAQVNNVDVNEGWYDPVSGGSWSDLTEAQKDARIASGDHMVPGSNGGFPWVKHWGTMDNGAHHDTIGYQFEVGDNTVLRVSWRKLHKIAAGRYRAGCRKLLGVSRKQKKAVKANNWILVDDPSDVVKVVLRWAGFREWEVESFGARLSKPWVFHQSDYFIDIINYVKSQGDYVFFMGDPTANDLSIGVPVFRHNRALQDLGNEGVPEFRDTNLLTGTDLKISAPPKATLIRARGALPVKGQRGTVLGEDTTRHVSASYRPPWARSYEQAGINRFETMYDRNLETELDCRVACILVAFQMALAANAAMIEVPGFPAVDLDEKVSVVDEGTGLTSRMYVAQVSENFQVLSDGGGSASNLIWKSQFGGALIDTVDIVGLAEDYIATLAQKAALSDSIKQLQKVDLKPVPNVWST